MWRNNKFHIVLICLLSVGVSLIYSSGEISMLELPEGSDEKIAEISFRIGFVIGLIISFLQPMLTIGFISLLLWLFLLLQNVNLRYKHIFENGIKPYYVQILGQIGSLFLVDRINAEKYILENNYFMFYSLFFIFLWWIMMRRKSNLENKYINFSFLGSLFILSLFAITGYLLS